MANPASLGLIVEGPYDEAIFKQLIPRLLIDADAVLAILSAGGVSKLLQGFPTLLSRLEQRLAGKPVHKAMVIRDTGMRAPQEVEADLASRAERRAFRFPREVQFCGIRQEIEAWLLADEDAITRVARGRGVGRHPVASVNETIEEIIHPKERLQAALSECGLPYTDVVCGEIAAEMNLDRLRYRCPSFRRFEKKLHDC